MSESTSRTACSWVSPLACSTLSLRVTYAICLSTSARKWC